MTGLEMVLVPAVMVGFVVWVLYDLQKEKIRCAERLLEIEAECLEEQTERVAYLEEVIEAQRKKMDRLEASNRNWVAKYCATRAALDPYQRFREPGMLENLADICKEPKSLVELAQFRFGQAVGWGREDGHDAT